jgi:formylmethanofuran dehydrogenase subunit E
LPEKGVGGTDLDHKAITLPEDLRRCIDFHGHLCPGLMYGYLVGREASRLLALRRSEDEEVVAFPENDSCAVDALQVLLGTTAGKGNLIFRDYGKNAYTVLQRKTRRAFRFSRKTEYVYGGEDRADFELLGKKIAAKTASPEENAQHRQMKALDLLTKDFSAVFAAEEIPPPEQPYAPLASSAACARCGEMTMATRLVAAGPQGFYCLPCAEKKDASRVPPVVEK